MPKTQRFDVFFTFPSVQQLNGFEDYHLVVGFFKRNFSLSPEEFHKPGHETRYSPLLWKNRSCFTPRRWLANDQKRSPSEEVLGPSYFFNEKGDLFLEIYSTRGTLFLLFIQSSFRRNFRCNQITVTRSSCRFVVFFRMLFFRIRVNSILRFCPRATSRIWQSLKKGTLLEAIIFKNAVTDAEN